MKRSGWPKAESVKDRQAEIRQILAILHKWGIHTLGQLAALDKEELAARLGPEAVRMWERANGQSNRLLKLVRPPEAFEESFEFEHEIGTAEPLLFMLRRFLEQLSLRLSAIYLVAKELTLRITFANPPAVPRDGFAAANKQRYERVFKIPQPTNDVDLLFRMLHTHLENFKSEHAITAVSLDAQPTKPPKHQFGLFETTLRNPNQLSETLARLTALLGVDRVGTPVLDETHRPDAFRIEPFAWDAGGTTSVSPHYSLDATERVPPIALRRFRPAAPASVFISENVPAHFQSKKISGKVIDQRGPYLISGNWWDEKSWACSEWDLQLENGILCRCHQSPSSLRSGVAGVEKWEVDGIYD
jgi:protein ImuB